MGTWTTSEVEGVLRTLLEQAYKLRERARERPMRDPKTRQKFWESDLSRMIEDIKFQLRLARVRKP